MDKQCETYMIPSLSALLIKERNVNSSHLSALKQKHSDLEYRLAQEEKRPMPDELLIHDLKKLKLALKDEIAHESEIA